MSLSLVRALRTGLSPRIAFIGAGGKTTAMFQIARALCKDNESSTVIVTATSHLGTWQIPLADIHIIAESPAALEGNKHILKGVVLVTGDLDGERTKPLNDHTLNWLYRYCEEHSLPLLIEADGSREKPLKAWTQHEPPIPPFVNQVVQVVGMTGIGKPLNDEHVHRAEIFSNLSGLNMGEPVTTDALVHVLEHKEGGLKNIPAHARKTLLLNQADTPVLQAVAHRLVTPLLFFYNSVVISSLKQETVFASHEPISGIILAAGESTRFGEAKQLLDWKGKPFVRAVAMTALESGLSPVIVVTGANAEKVESSLKDLGVIIVRNNDWKSGQGSSIKEGIKALTQPPQPLPSAGHLPQIRHKNLSLQSNISFVGFGGGWEGVGGAIFLLTDQPQITTSILRALVQRHVEGLYPIVAPIVMDQRANPVLFDRDTFPDLMTLEGDVGGRAIFHKHRVEYLPWHDDRLLLDVDTPEMYQRLISDETL
jgi:molybdenum cofactor cytidylyltransferase